MKIDFNAKFTEITTRLQKAATTSNLPRQDFGKVIGEFLGNKPKAEQLQAVKPDSEAIKNGNGKGRFDFAPLNFLMPPVTLQAPAITSQTTASSDVKNPTLSSDLSGSHGLTALTPEKKIEPPIKNAFAGLDQNQRKEKVQELVQRAAEKYGIDPALSLAVASVESSFNPAATSQDGHFSKGLMQLLDGTGKEHLEEGENYKPYDPAQNVTLGVSYLRKLHDLFTTPETLNNNLSTVAAANSTSLEKIAVAAYNAGEGRVAWAQDQAKRAGKNPANFDEISTYLPEITQQYVTKVVSARESFEARFDG